MGFSPLELGVVVTVIVLLFGVKRIPELGSSLGLGINNFKKAFKDSSAIDVTPSEKKEEDKGTDTPETPKSSNAP
jgi:sec-independent protein translocase protein TatA